MAAAPDVNIETIIDRAAMGGYRIWIVALCFGVAMIDGFDTQSIAFVAPEIASSWGLPAASFGPVFGIGLFGGLLGAMGIGAAGDRWGRKRVLIGSIAIFAAASLTTVVTATLPELILARFVTGLGLGGAIPSIIAITSEYAPRRRRASIVTMMFCGFPLGAVVGGAASAKLIPLYHWPAVFYLGSALPLLILPAIIFGLPESIRFLAAARRAAPAQVIRILARIDRRARFPAATRFFMPEKEIAGSSLRHLFSDGRAAGTLLLWCTFFMSLLLAFFLVNWMPVVLRQAGFPIETAVMATVMLNAGGIVGSLVFARLIDRFGACAVIWPGYAVGTVFVALIGLAHAGLPAMLAIVSLAGCFSIGAQLSAVTLAASFYPTTVRATGIGWAMGVGRIGAIAGPVLGGLLLGSGLGASDLFLAAAAASLLAGLAILIMGQVAGAAPAEAIAASAARTR